MKSDWRTYLVLTAVTLAAYWGVWRHGFVNYDDDDYVRVQAGLTLDGVAWAFRVARKGLATALLERNRVAEARAHLERARELKPDDADVLCNLGLVLERQGEARRAAALYEEALRVRPDFGVAHNNVGVLRSAAGRPEEALGHFDEVVRTLPSCARGHFNLGYTLVQLGRPDEAVDHFRTAVELLPARGGPAQQGIYRFHLAAALEEAGRGAEAAGWYEEALRFNGQWPEIALQRAREVLTAADPHARNAAEAVFLARRGCHVGPERQAEALETLSEALAAAGKLE